jgi:hypothetical protein
MNAREVKLKQAPPRRMTPGACSVAVPVRRGDDVVAALGIGRSLRPGQAGT